MRAVAYDRYGPPEVLHLEEVPIADPQPGEVRVRVLAATMNRFDCHTREANRSNGVLVSGLSRLISGPLRPRRRILGSEFAGVVDIAGPGVTELKPGDEVFGNTGMRFGSHAEYVCVRAAGCIARKPSGIGFDSAAAITDGALNSLWCLRLGEVGEGKSVLVYGASGAIGTAGVQLARHLGAEVTAVCGTPNLDLALSLGANRVIDYLREDFTRDGRTYDVVFDAVGKLDFGRVWRSLKPGGCYLPTDGIGNLYHAAWTARRVGRRVVFKLPPRFTQDDARLLAKLAETGEFRPVIDRRYPLDETVVAARYVETGQKVGNVVIEVGAQRPKPAAPRARSS